MNPPGLSLSFQSFQPEQPRQRMFPFIQRSSWKTLPCPNSWFWGCDKSKPWGFQGLDLLLCRQSSLSTQGQLHLMLPGRWGRSSNSLPQPGIKAQNLDTTEWHLQSLSGPRVPSAATSKGHGHWGEISAAGKTQPHLFLDLIFPFSSANIFSELCTRTELAERYLQSSSIDYHGLQTVH